MVKLLILVNKYLIFNNFYRNNFNYCFVVAAIMKNTGVLIANDVNKNRAKAVIGNFHRMGIANSVISTCDGRNIPQVTYICFFFFYYLLTNSDHKLQFLK